MTTILRFVLSLVVFVTLSAPAFAQGYEKVVIAGKLWQVPTMIDIKNYPPIGPTMTPLLARVLDVHLEPLEEAGWFDNELRERGTFDSVWLDHGEPVWVSNSPGPQRALYWDRCKNRINRKVKKPEPTTQQPTVPVIPQGAQPKKLTPKLRSFWQGIVDVFVGVGNAVAWPFVRYE